ncbi:MAG TPA: preprotein translocase subunit YajC [Anaeromyxobacteraceae bacterium]|nr:preprotein translocase subunit YajC [Anaeromyxobacteraceae bacterium]
MLAPSGQQGGGAISVFVLQIAAFIAIFYFILIRPQRQQQKRHEELLKQVKRGDEVVTSGGVVGEIVHVKDDRITVKSGEARLVIERRAIARVVTRTTEEASAT